MAKLKIEKWIRDLQRPLTDAERSTLKDAIQRDKQVRDPVVVMQGDVLVDGHNRYEIATELGYDAPVEIVTFKDPKTEVPLWIWRNQAGRRNLTPDEFKLYLGRLYNATKEEHGGDRKSSPQNEDLIGEQPKTSEKIAQEVGVSKATVERAGKTAELVDQLAKPLQTAYQAGGLKVNQGQLERLASMTPSDQQVAARQVRVGGKQWDQVLPKPKKNGKPKKKIEKTQGQLIADRAKSFCKTLDNFAPCVDEWTTEENILKTDYRAWLKEHWTPAVVAFKKLSWRTKGE